MIVFHYGIVGGAAINYTSCHDIEEEYNTAVHINSLATIQEKGPVNMQATNTALQILNFLHNFFFMGLVQTGFEN